MKKVMVHCSDSRWGNAAVITKWHLERENHFKLIGYHYVILNGRTSAGHNDPYFDGSIETGRSPEINGAHCKGHNDSIGICLIGKSGRFTANQIGGLKTLLRHLTYIYGDILLQQHSDYDDKKMFCAGLDLAQFSDFGLREE